MRWVLSAVLLVACAAPATTPPPTPSPSTTLVIPVPQPEPAPASPEVVMAAPPATKRSRLVAISVDKRLPALAAEHANNPGYGYIRHDLAKRAIASATDDMLVTFTTSPEPVRPVALFTINDDGAFMGWGKVSQGDLAPFGVETWFGYAPSDRNYVLFIGGETPALVPGTPGLIWKAMPNGVLFLSLDGETYELPLDGDASSLRLGALPPAEWPTFNPVFGRMALGIGRREGTTPLAKRDAAFERCADFIWTATKKKMTAKQREEAWAPDSGVVIKHCAATIRAWEKAFVENVRASQAQRQALRDTAKERLRLER